MSGHAPLERDLAELYKARGVRKVVYFHCDHWEPWRSVPGRPMICEPNVEDVQRFVEATQKLDFARKLTLFYKPYLDSILNPEIQPPRSEHAHLHDAVYFPQRTDAQLAMCRRAIRQVSEHSSHEFQVHVHHENYTFNHGHRSEHALDYFSTPECRTYEEDRFALAVNLTLEAIEYESGQMLDRWFFVHGNWALNASDPTVCHIVREIEILKSLGCLGDFTFPAGREHVNPRLEVPYFARPTSEPKGYDLQQSDPQLAYGNGAAAAEKFFIWASFIKHGHASLDYYAPWLRKRLDDTAMHTREIVQRSYCVDGILFIKSHAHSMHPLYFTDGKAPVFPHEDPAIATMFRTLFSAAALAGADVEFLTASEVYDLFVTANHVPHHGRALIIPGEAADLSLIRPPPRSTLGNTWQSPSRLIVKPTLPPAVQTTQASPVKPVVVLQTLVAVGGLADADLINTRAIAVMARRIQDLGEGPSGASSYYADRVRQAAMLTNYEIKLAQYFLDSPTKFANYYEIGSGASTFPVLLAANCMPATGIEIDSRRHAAALDILQDLQAEFARQSRSLPATCTLLRGGVPAILEALDLENSVGIVTNLTTSISVQQRLDFIRSLLKFPVVILDVQRFVTRQTTPGTEDALVAELVLAGFTKPEIILDLGSNGRYFRLAGRGGLTSAIVMPATHVAA